MIKLLAIVALFGVSNAEVFTAMADMEAIIGAEKDVVKIIDQYIEAEMQRLTKLKQFAKEYDERNIESFKLGKQDMSNPINAYLVVKQLSQDWGYVESLIKHGAADEFLHNVTVERSKSRVKFPDIEDLEGAAAALLRLQDVYTLETTAMARGEIQGVKRAKELSANDCFELGRVAYNMGDHYHCIMWMEEALRRVNNPTLEPSKTGEAEIVEFLAYSLFKQGNLKRALIQSKRLQELVPDHPRAAGNIKYYEDQLKLKNESIELTVEIPPLENARFFDSNLPERDMYEALCRGEHKLPPKKAAKLSCFYKTDRPFLKIAPIRAEVVHLEPIIYVFRDVLSLPEVEMIKRLAYPKLMRSLVQNPKTGELIPTSSRIAKSAWLKATEDPGIDRINKRVALMTDLNMETAEELQVANYGLGGHYDPHFDFARMTQPEAGGATVFPDLKVSVFPTKQDAVFWYNLYKSGEGDLITKHAACPVLAGTKWVSNKWIHERGQEFHRPCGLSEKAYE